MQENIKRQENAAKAKLLPSFNLLKILSIGENDIKNKRVYSHEQIQKKVRAILD